IGLTFGIPGVIMDRWKFVEFWLPTAMEGRGAATTSQYFTYGNNTPSDPVGIYGVYGGVDSSNEALSLAMYEAFETVLDSAISKSPDLQKQLGVHANAGGMHWHGWNAIKNDAVGHSSLDLTKDLIKAHGVYITADKVYTAITNGNYYTEGAETQQSNVKFVLDRGKVRVERASVASGLQQRPAGVSGQGTGTGTGKSGTGTTGKTGTDGYSITTAAGLENIKAQLDKVAIDPEVRFNMMQRASENLAKMVRDIGFRDDVAAAANEAGMAQMEQQQATTLAGVVDRYSAEEQQRLRADEEALKELKAKHETALQDLSVKADIEAGGAQADGWTTDQKDALKVRQRLEQTTLQARQRAETLALETKQQKATDAAKAKERQEVNLLKQEQAAQRKANEQKTGEREQRATMLDYLAALDTILMPFPAEVRNKCRWPDCGRTRP
ncbi:MAG: hypothetical protein JZU63_12605, partial [Rhodoferax sp.]|nr:hypothetical protein [Rhodoferax sp.]